MNNRKIFMVLSVWHTKNMNNGQVSMFPRQKEPSRNETAPIFAYILLVITSFCRSSLKIEFSGQTKVDIQNLTAQVTEQVTADEHQRIAHLFRQSRTAVPALQI